MTCFLFLCVLAGDGPPYYKRPVDPVADLAELKVAIQAGSLSEQLWLNKINIYTSLGELLEASELVELLCTTFPQQAVFEEARMILYSLSKRHDEAVGVGEQILQKYPAHRTIRPNLARVYLKAGNRAKGFNMMFSALEQGPILANDWKLLLRHLALATPDPEKMVHQLEQKAAQNPQLRSLKYVLMVVCVRLGRYARARDILLADPALANHDDIRAFLATVPQLNMSQTAPQ